MADEDVSSSTMPQIIMNIKLELSHLKRQHLKKVNQLYSKIDKLEREIYCLQELIKDRNLEIGLFKRDALLHTQKLRKLRDILDTEEQTEDEEEFKD